jgi:uncharacterized membrane protein
MRVEESIEINRPLEEVFDYVSEVGNFPEWSAHTLEVRKDTAGHRSRAMDSPSPSSPLAAASKRPTRGPLMKRIDGIWIEP